MFDSIIKSAKELIHEQLPKISTEIQRYIKRSAFDPISHVTAGHLKVDQVKALGEVTVDYSVNNLTGLSSLSIDDVSFDFGLSGDDNSKFSLSDLLYDPTHLRGSVSFSISVKDLLHADLSGTVAAISKLFNRKDNFKGGITFNNGTLQAEGSIVVAFNPIHRSIELEDIHIETLKPGYDSLQIDLDGLEEFGILKGLILSGIEKAAKLEIGDLASNSLRVMLNRALDEFEHQSLELTL